LRESRKNHAKTDPSVSEDCDDKLFPSLINRVDAPGGGDAMLCLQNVLLRLTASGVVLFAFNSSLASAGDHFRREPAISHWSHHTGRYTREVDHGLIHYPTATYWASGIPVEPVDRWDATGTPQAFSYDITPSPWAYRFIAPYKHQYHSFDGTGYFSSECYDCRN
jgi:hypothetical protein